MRFSIDSPTLVKWGSHERFFGAILPANRNHVAMRFLALALLAPALVLLPTGEADDLARWGADGHEMIGLVAAETLPEDMPMFFRESAAQLAFLNPEPDRWRNRSERDLDPAMDGAHAPEHYINFERLPEGALLARTRYAYMDTLSAHGISLPGPGLLPWRILEMTQRLRVGFRDWRAAESEEVRAWIEARIINDAGVLGHYVADGANPHHTTLHHNGWVGDNPRGFTTERGFHGRFESLYVRENIEVEEVRGAVFNDARVLQDVREEAWRFLLDAHQLVERLYELDQMEQFGANTQGVEHREFTLDRLSAGAEMLRDLWWTAWMTSEW